MKFNQYILILIVVVIASCGEKKSKLDTEDVPTWIADISPIIHQNCMPCHRPEGGGPFNLIEYNDVAKRKKMIAYVTGVKYMPPWPADKSYSHFINERGLTDEQIQLIKDWVENGALYGDSTKEIIPPVYPTGSHLGKPDLVIEMRDSFLIKGDNRDKFMMMKVPYEIPQDTFIRAIEFVPGNKNLVHHMNGHLISYQEGKKTDVQEGEHVLDYHKLDNDLEKFEILGIPNDDGTYPVLTESVVNYLPSVVPSIYPNGIGGYKMTKKGAIMMNDIHYGPTPKDAYDKSKFNIFFAKSKPKRLMQENQLGTLGISEIEPALVIPPDTIMKFKTKFIVPNKFSLLTINPHMHLLGKSFLAYILTPLGDTIPLIKIPRWDFRWQYFYTFPKILVVEKGSTIVVEAEFDNTKDNPFNPYDPPQEIKERDGSMKTTDEMLQLIMMYVPYQKGDENISLENVNFN